MSVIGALGAAAPAAAGTYDVWSCRGPSGEPTATDAWERAAADSDGNILVATAAVAFADTCDAPDGGLSVALAQGDLLSGPVAGMLTFRPAPHTRIARYELARRLQAGQPPLLATYVSERLETAAGNEVDFDSCDSSCGTLGGPDADAPASIVVREQPQGDAIALRVAASCVLVCADLGSIPARAELYRSRVTLEDVEAPALPQLSGPLVDGGPTSGRAALTVSGSDAGSGIEAVSMTIDGVPWQTVRADNLAASCREPYSLATPCPAEIEQPLEIDTGALAPGDHVAAGAVVDAAGNSTAWGPLTFRVESPAVTVPEPPVTLPEPPLVVLAPPTARPRATNGVPAVERPLLRISRPRRDARPGTLVRLDGSLTTADGKPIAGARLAVATERLGLREQATVAKPAATVSTDAAGRFSVARRARGALRVTVGFSPRPGAAATAAAAAIVRAQLALHAAPARDRLTKHRLLTLRGRLIGAGPSARGALVQIQAIVNGRWTPVGRTRARGDGRFVWRYRFVHLTRDTIFSFRPVVERVPGWPWSTVRGQRTLIRVDVP